MDDVLLCDDDPVRVSEQITASVERGLALQGSPVVSTGTPLVSLGRRWALGRGSGRRWRTAA